MFEREPQTPYPIGYPTREDFDPAQVPCPLDLKARRMLSSLCVMLAMQSAEVEAGGTDAPENPFSPGAVTFETRYPIMFGTGMPSSLTEAEVLPVIREVFTQAGIELDTHQMVKEDKLEFQIDGISGKGSIGFEWMTYEDKSFVEKTQAHGLLDPQGPGITRDEALARYRETMAERIAARGKPLDETYIKILEGHFQGVLDELANPAYTAEKPLAAGKLPLNTARLAGWVDGTLQAVDRKIERDGKGFSPEEVKFITESWGSQKRFVGFIDATRYDHHPRDWDDPRDPARLEAIEKLRRDVKQFLDWAWSQGAF